MCFNVKQKKIQVLIKFGCCSPDVRVYAYAAAQVKKAMEVWMIILFSINLFILLLLRLSCGMMLCV